MPIPLDEYPIHQAPVSMKHFGTSDRNVYDRCIYQCTAHDGSTQLILGLGVYPHLGVIDGYAVVRQGTTQRVVRTSDALSDDRMTQTVGPLRIEVVEPLRKLRVVLDADELGVGFDLTFTGSAPAHEEPRHFYRIGNTVILDACRFMQTGTFAGSLRVDGATIDVTPDTFVGTRDRSWGIRPVGEPTPPGRPNAAAHGHWWAWVPLRFDDFSLMVITQETSEGERILNTAVRLWHDGRVEPLGWPEYDITYRSGSRHPERAVITMTDANRKPLVLEVETLGGVPLSVGCGYGGDPDWSHGTWKGEGWVEGATYDLTEASIQARMPFMHIDHAARATLDGQTGYGIFEHASIGAHAPTGFEGFEMAP